jgi:hypothetical protein
MLNCSLLFYYIVIKISYVYVLYYQALRRLNHLGLTLSTTSKLKLLDEAGNRMETSVASTLQRNPIVKVNGDNPDIYVRTGHKSLERSNQDIHLFASNIIFSRVGIIAFFSE